MMKKEARLKAESMFLKAEGKITNKEIAQALRVNALTVGRWKSEDDWASALAEREGAARGDGRPSLVRKRSARDMAERLYRKAGGNISNKELAAAVGVSAATISKWKGIDRWIEKIEFQTGPHSTETEPVDHTTRELSRMTAPGQIIEINRRIDQILAREHLNADEVVHLAAAKHSLMAAVVSYLSITREIKKLEPSF